MYALTLAHRWMQLMTYQTQSVKIQHSLSNITSQPWTTLKQYRHRSINLALTCSIDVFWFENCSVILPTRKCSLQKFWICEFAPICYCCTHLWSKRRPLAQSQSGGSRGRAVRGPRSCMCCLPAWLTLVPASYSTSISSLRTKKYNPQKSSSVQWQAKWCTARLQSTVIPSWKLVSGHFVCIQYSYSDISPLFLWLCRCFACLTGLKGMIHSLEMISWTAYRTITSGTNIFEIATQHKHDDSIKSYKCLRALCIASLSIAHLSAELLSRTETI